MSLLNKIKDWINEVSQLVNVESIDFDELAMTLDEDELLNEFHNMQLDIRPDDVEKFMESLFDDENLVYHFTNMFGLFFDVSIDGEVSPQIYAGFLEGLDSKEREKVYNVLFPEDSDTMFIRDIFSAESLYDQEIHDAFLKNAETFFSKKTVAIKKITEKYLFEREC